MPSEHNLVQVFLRVLEQWGNINEKRREEDEKTFRMRLTFKFPRTFPGNGETTSPNPLFSPPAPTWPVCLRVWRALFISFAASIVMQVMNAWCLRVCVLLFFIDSEYSGRVVRRNIKYIRRSCIFHYKFVLTLFDRLILPRVHLRSDDDEYKCFLITMIRQKVFGSLEGVWWRFRSCRLCSHED